MVHEPRPRYRRLNGLLCRRSVIHFVQACLDVLFGLFSCAPWQRHGGLKELHPVDHSLRKTVNNVNLTPEGRLLVQSFDSASRSSNSFKDITAVAHHYLFEQIELPSDTTVRSIFLLLSHNSTLRNIYSRYLPDEMLHEAFASSIPYDLSGGIDPSEVEYTEVFRVFEKNTADTSLF